MRIKQPLWAIISGVLFLVLVGYAVERLSFLLNAERATGTVVALDARNTSCRSGRRSYSCTKFSATVHFQDRGAAWHSLAIPAGSARGYNHETSRASLRVHDEVSVVYDPSNPTKAYQDTFWAVWSGPIFVAIFQISAFFGSISEPRKKES